MREGKLFFFNLLDWFFDYLYFKVLYKLDKIDCCQFFDRRNLRTFLNERNLSFTQFRRLCILFGCDYLQNLPGVGLANAEKIVRGGSRGSFFDISRQFSKFNFPISEQYVRGFWLAEHVFLRQTYFNLSTNRLEPRPRTRNRLSIDLNYYSGKYAEAVFSLFSFC